MLATAARDDTPAGPLVAGAKGVVDLSALRAFLPCETPAAWVDRARQELPLLLIDHANCEKKAAATAMSLMNRYVEHHHLLNKMSKLAREELRHFEQVIGIMRRRGIAYQVVSASRYASGLRELVRKDEPQRLVDTLLVGGLIEARSCERFAALIPAVDAELGAFYASLLKSEARHFTDYVRLAQALTGSEEIEARLAVLREREVQLICEPDAQFRFHSGVPIG